MMFSLKLRQIDSEIYYILYKRSAICRLTWNMSPFTVAGSSPKASIIVKRNQSLMLSKINGLLGVFWSAILPPHLGLLVFASSIASLCYQAN